MSSAPINSLLEKRQSKIRFIGPQNSCIRQIKDIIGNTSPDSEKLFVAEGIWAHHDFDIYLADPKADKTYRSFTYQGKTALVMGSERYGLSKEWYDCDAHPLSIPMRGICDSLNVGVAASIIIYEIYMKRIKTPYDDKQKQYSGGVLIIPAIRRRTGSKAEKRCSPVQILRRI